jgi:1,4-dihydroxy-2-naphthoate octaprenyltransferase
MKLKFLKQALTTIPRVSVEEWRTLDILSRWLIATRAAVIVMTLIAAAIAGIIAFRENAFHWDRWLLLAGGLSFAHATNNLLNDLSDFRRGVDENNYYRTQYGPQPLAHGMMTIRQNLLYSAITGALALACGLPLVLQAGIYGWLLLASGAFFVLFYTWPLKYIALGEVAVFLVWGPLMIVGGHFVITGHWSMHALMASVPYGLGVTGVIFGKHIDKATLDRAKRIFTLPVVIGERVAKAALAAFILLQYVLVLAMIAFAGFHPALLLVAFAFPALKIVLPQVLSEPPTEAPAWFPKNLWPTWYVALAFYHNRQFGLFYIMGLLIDAIIWQGRS